MPRILGGVALVVTVASALAGAVAAVLSALVVGLVSLFYNGTGGALIFLGSLIGLLPRPFVAVNGTSSLPAFRQLGTNVDAIVLRSVAATILCSVAVAIVVASTGRRNGRSWLAVGLCCLLAAIVGDRPVALSVMPAVAVSIGQLVWQRRRDHG
jgi:hypothetical protein